MSQFTWTCGVCGATFESLPGESWSAFCDRVYDAHTVHHVNMGELPDDALGNLQDASTFCAHMAHEASVANGVGCQDAKRVFAELALRFAGLAVQLKQRKA